MALQAYLKVTAASQGDIAGSITQKTREDSIGVIAVSHQIVSPRDAASGMPTGKRMHKPFVITKELDKATPKLYGALVTNENLPKWVLKFYTPGTAATKNLGTEVNHYTVELVNANIASIDFVMKNNRRQENMQFPECEEIAFTYQKIIWTWNEGGLSASDDWEAPPT
jgi:type VI secretion system secreted protein Hcp